MAQLCSLNIGYVSSETWWGFYKAWLHGSSHKSGGAEETTEFYGELKLLPTILMNSIVWLTVAVCLIEVFLLYLFIPSFVQACTRNTCRNEDLLIAICHCYRHTLVEVLLVLLLLLCSKSRHSHWSVCSDKKKYLGRNTCCGKCRIARKHSVRFGLGFYINT